MKKVERFEAEDGTIFETEDECNRYESKEALIQLLINEKYFTYDQVCTVKEVVNFLYEHGNLK